MDKYFDFSAITSFESIFNSDSSYLKVNLDFIFTIKNRVSPTRQTLRINLDCFKTSYHDSKVLGVPFDEIGMLKLLLSPYFRKEKDSISFGYIDQSIEIEDGTESPFKIIYSQIEKVIVTEISSLPI